ncbi:thioredoxin [Williamsia sp. CHRR-6]|uniref:thioredoxin n=1 Tax=Williamsia sp. CHRR-6 TaxID=2835871 RepID=UPI001BDB0BD8|nr:thioredoxin [Williamsia sp. CHRR-6]MBT0568239.1 thioredoxin [Williamsia sp. CHRR-6]
MTGAVDLSALKERADAARNRPPSRGASPAPAGGPATSAATAGATGANGPASAAPAAVVDVTEETFEAEVLARSEQVLVLVDLWATWCGPCKQLSPVLEQLAADADGQWVLAKVDIDANPRIAQAFGVQSVPTVIAIALGQPVAAFQGVQPAAQITGWVNEILAKVGDRLTGMPTEGASTPTPEPVDPQVAAAEQLLESGDLAAAAQAYRAIADSDPGNLEAASVVRNLDFMMRAQQHDPAIVDSAAADDRDGQFAAADVLLLNQQPEAAFDRLITLVRLTAGEDRTAARTRLLSLFELFDPAEPFVVAARRKLASALF